MTGGYQGIGFAIPINKARNVAAQLITSGRVARPWLGIAGVALSDELARALNVGVQEGVLVVEVVPGSPADRAGLRGGTREVQIGNLRLPVGGDILLSVNGEPIADMDALIQKVEQHKVGEEIAVEVWRNGRRRNVALTLQERPT